MRIVGLQGTSFLPLSFSQLIISVRGKVHQGVYAHRHLYTGQFIFDFFLQASCSSLFHSVFAAGPWKGAASETTVPCPAGVPSGSSVRVDID